MLAASASIAHADRADIYATANGDVAVTDNVFSEGRGNQDADIFTQVRPGIRLIHGMRRMINDLTVEAEITQYARFSKLPSFSGRAAWQALLFTGPRSEMVLSANAQSGVLNALSANAWADASEVQLQPLGRLSFRATDGSEYASYLLSREYRLNQRLFARASRSDDNLMEPTIVTSAEAGGTVGVTRSFEVSSLSLEAGASIVRMEREAPEGAPMGSRLDRQYNPRARAAYRREFDRNYSLQVDTGAVYVIPYGVDPYNPDDRERSNGLFPILGAQLTLSDNWGVGIASLRRDVTPNLLVAQNTVSDVAKVSAGIPLAWEAQGIDARRRQPKLVLIGAVTALHTQLIDPITSEVDNSFWIGRIDAGVQYAYRPGITYSLRYELMVQSSGEDSFGDPVPGFYRNTIFFTFKLRYPADVPVTVPRNRQKGVRNDRRDLIPLGAEPVIPELDAESSGSDEDLR